MRQPLVNVGGPTRELGDPRVSRTLAGAMDAAAHEDPDALTHGFHAWPARMHRAIARIVIAAATQPGERVLDPFCGSGTVLIEATVAGRRAAGVDLNPLAVPLAMVKCERRDARARQRFLEITMMVGEASVERVRAREKVIAQLPGPMLGLYGPHVLKEMAGLLEEIRTVSDDADRRALEMVFSSLVVKLSRRQAETTTKRTETEKRIRKGLTTELFVRKCEELVMRWASLDEALAEDASPPRVFEGDARQLSRLLGDRVKAQLVLTSPPYGGTYDYYEQHALRLAWLGMNAENFERSEIGARRSAKVDEDEAAERWDRDVSAMLASISGVLERERSCVLLMGDGRFGRHLVPLLPQLESKARRAGLTLFASASQKRADWGFGAPREEHLVALRKVD
jgi:hypothetical protein